MGGMTGHPTERLAISHPCLVRPQFAECKHLSVHDVPRAGNIVGGRSTFVVRDWDDGDAVAPVPRPRSGVGAVVVRPVGAGGRLGTKDPGSAGRVGGSVRG